MRAVALVVFAVVSVLALSTQGPGVSVARAASTATHPLEPLSAAELQATYQAVRAHFTTAGLPTQSLRFPEIALNEPPKAIVLAWAPGQTFPREARALVMHYPSNRLWVAIVDLVSGRVRSLALQPAGTQGPVTIEESQVAEALVRAHGPWQQAMRGRGLDPDLVHVDVWAPGDLDVPSRAVARGGTPRVLRALSFDRGAPLGTFDPARPQNPYARPVEGVVVTLDMNRRRVVHVNDTLRRPVSIESGNAATPRARLKPLRLVQPEGSNVTVDGRQVSWQGWHFRVALTPREGLVLYDVRYEDGGRRRPVAYRLSLSELYAPYGVPDANWVFRAALDVGEYNAGMFAQPLEINRDVPENAILLDAVLGSDVGPSAANPTGTVAYPATIALHERHSGMLWSRTDPSNLARDTRLGRELVVTWSAWIGNYVYAFDWIFRMDASIEVRVRASGTLLGRGAGDADEPSAPTVGIDARGTRVAAGVHQHFINYRLDLDIDGADNAVFQSNVGPLGVPGFKNAFAAEDVAHTREGFDDVNPASARTWHIKSASRRNALGEPTGYELIPGETAVPYSSDDFPALARAAFARHPFWVTKYKEGELYAAGDFPNQGMVGAGLPAFISPPEALGPDGGGSDLVVWYTAGFTHIPRPEDYPVMPTESLGFRLVPHGFFSRNPALDVPDQK